MSIAISSVQESAIAQSNQAMAVCAENTRALQAIAAEVSDYSKRLVEDGTMTLAQVVQSHSLPEAFNVLAAFGKRTAQEYVQQWTKIASMYQAAAHQQSVALQAVFMTPVMPVMPGRR
jgi:hypothetical protein